MEHLMTARVRYTDTDQMGYMHHARYLEYFEMGRTEYMRATGCSYADIEKSGYFLVLVATNLVYRKPARYDMEITIRTRIKKITHAQVTFEYTAQNGHDVLCECWTKLACIDRNGKLRRMPEEIRKALKGDRQ